MPKKQTDGFDSQKELRQKYEDAKTLLGDYFDLTFGLSDISPHTHQCRENLRRAQGFAYDIRVLMRDMEDLAGMAYEPKSPLGKVT